MSYVWPSCFVQSFVLCSLYETRSSLLRHLFSNVWIVLPVSTCPRVTPVTQDRHYQGLVQLVLGTKPYLNLVVLTGVGVGPQLEVLQTLAVLSPSVLALIPHPILPRCLHSFHHDTVHIFDFLSSFGLLFLFLSSRQLL